MSRKIRDDDRARASEHTAAHERGDVPWDEYVGTDAFREELEQDYGQRRLFEREEDENGNSNQE